MRRFTLTCLVVLTGLALPAVAQASDSSLEHALSGYESRLTSDIGYLASFSTPSRRGAAAVLSRVPAVQRDLTNASRAAKGQQASSSSGRTGRTLVLAALALAYRAAGEAKSAALAVRSGKSSVAKRDASAEQSAIDQAIVQFEQGGKLLHLS